MTFEPLFDDPGEVDFSGSGADILICTKSDLVLRDLDLLKELGQVTVSWSINTLGENFKYDCPFVDNEMPYGRVPQGHPVTSSYKLQRPERLCLSGCAAIVYSSNLPRHKLCHWFFRYVNAFPSSDFGASESLPQAC